MHTGNRSADQQRQMFISSEHTQTAFYCLFFRNKNSSVNAAAVNSKHSR